MDNTECASGRLGRSPSGKQRLIGLGFGVLFVVWTVWVVVMTVKVVDKTGLRRSPEITHVCSPRITRLGTTKTVIWRAPNYFGQ